MPAARMAIYSKGVEIYLAPTADSRDTWQATLQHIACEGRCFVLGCNQFVKKDMYPNDLETLHELAIRKYPNNMVKVRCDFIWGLMESSGQIRLISHCRKCKTE